MGKFSTAPSGWGAALSESAPLPAAELLNYSQAEDQAAGMVCSLGAGVPHEIGTVSCFGSRNFIDQE